MKTTLRAALPLALLCFAGAADAATIEVKMLNRGERGTMVYEPEFIEIAPGDVLQFRATDRSHNAAAIEGMAPAGAAPFRGQIDQEIAVTFKEPGVYGVKCSPHYTMGMVMIVRVGGAPIPAGFLPADLPGPARKRFEEILARAGLAPP